MSNRSKFLHKLLITSALTLITAGSSNALARFVETNGADLNFFVPAANDVVNLADQLTDLRFASSDGLDILSAITINANVDAFDIHALRLSAAPGLMTVNKNTSLGSVWGPALVNQLGIKFGANSNLTLTGTTGIFPIAIGPGQGGVGAPGDQPPVDTYKLSKIDFSGTGSTLLVNATDGGLITLNNTFTNAGLATLNITTPLTVTDASAAAIPTVNIGTAPPATPSIYTISLAGGGAVVPLASNIVFADPTSALTLQNSGGGALIVNLNRDIVGAANGNGVVNIFTTGAVANHDSDITIGQTLPGIGNLGTSPVAEVLGLDRVTVVIPAITQVTLATVNIANLDVTNANDITIIPDINAADVNITQANAGSIITLGNVFGTLSVGTTAAVNSAINVANLNGSALHFQRGSNAIVILAAGNVGNVSTSNGNTGNLVIAAGGGAVQRGGNIGAPPAGLGNDISSFTYNGAAGDALTVASIHAATTTIGGVGTLISIGPVTSNVDFTTTGTLTAVSVGGSVTVGDNGGVAAAMLTTTGGAGVTGDVTVGTGAAAATFTNTGAIGGNVTLRAGSTFNQAGNIGGTINGAGTLNFTGASTVTGIIGGLTQLAAINFSAGTTLNAAATANAFNFGGATYTVTATDLSLVI